MVLSGSRCVFGVNVPPSLRCPSVSFGWTSLASSRVTSSFLPLLPEVLGGWDRQGPGRLKQRTGTDATTLDGHGRKDTRGVNECDRTYPESRNEDGGSCTGRYPSRRSKGTETGSEWVWETTTLRWRNRGCRSFHGPVVRT